MFPPQDNFCSLGLWKRQGLARTTIWLLVAPVGTEAHVPQLFLFEEVYFTCASVTCIQVQKAVNSLKMNLGIGLGLNMLFLCIYLFSFKPRCFI